MLSELLTAALTAIGKDVKAIFAKFDATGKLLKANLPTLTKADVGLSNVDNTADANKTVASAGKLTTARLITLKGGVTGFGYFDGSTDTSITLTVLSAAKLTNSRQIELTGDVTGAAYFNGSANASIATTLNSSSVYKAVNTVPFGYGAPAGNADTYPAGTKYFSNAPDNPFAPYSAFIETIQLGLSPNQVIQIAYGTQNTSGNVYDTSAGIMFRRFTVGGNNTPEQLAWRPISSSLITYNNTTNDAPNITIGSDGILRRSTAAGTTPTVLKAVMGSPSGALYTVVAHGLDPARIKAVYAKVEASANFWVWQNHMIGGTPPSYACFFTAQVSSSIVYLEAHSEATQIHGKEVTIIVETY